MRAQCRLTPASRPSLTATTFLPLVQPLCLPETAPNPRTTQGQCRTHLTENRCHALRKSRITSTARPRTTRLPSCSFLYNSFLHKFAKQMRIPMTATTATPRYRLFHSDFEACGPRTSGSHSEACRVFGSGPQCGLGPVWFGFRAVSRAGSTAPGIPQIKKPSYGPRNCQKHNNHALFFRR